MPGKELSETETAFAEGFIADPFVSRIVVKDGKWAAYEGAKAMR